MNIELIGVITIIIGSTAVIRGIDTGIFYFIQLTLLGSAAAILIGGSGSIQPAHLMLGFLLILVFKSRNYIILMTETLKFPREGFWLLALVAYGVSGAYLLPRLFIGATGIYAIGSIAGSGPSSMLVPLGPTSGNITQSIYFIADAFCFLLVSSYASDELRFERLLSYMITYSYLNIIFAFADMITSFTNTGFILDFIRNANYDLHVDEVTSGLRRIVGSFTETSSFSYATLGSLGFTGRLWLAGYKKKLTGLASALSLLLLIFSTSTTAYATTPILLLLLYAGSFVRLIKGFASVNTFMFLLIAPMLTLMVGLMVALSPTANEAVRNFLDVVIFNKATSQSGVERGAWNQSAIQNFIDTFWLGGGLGSIRTSSFPLAVLSNLGILGAAGFTVFFARVFFTKKDKTDNILLKTGRSAAKISCAGLLIASVISGSLVDLGLSFYIFAGIACAGGEKCNDT